MHLNLSLPELEAGKSVQTGAADRILDMCLAADRRDPCTITPLKDHDQRLISIVRFTEDGRRMSPGCCEVKFRPVWNKTFTLYSSKEKLLALIIELTEGKYWVDNDGFKPCKLTTNGNGTDPRAVLDSHFTLSELMNAPRRHYIVLQAIELIKQYA